MPRVRRVEGGTVTVAQSVFACAGIVATLACIVAVTTTWVHAGVGQTHVDASPWTLTITDDMDGDATHRVAWSDLAELGGVTARIVQAWGVVTHVAFLGACAVLPVCVRYVWTAQRLTLAVALTWIACVVCTVAAVVFGVTATVALRPAWWQWRIGAIGAFVAVTCTWAMAAVIGCTALRAVDVVRAEYTKSYVKV
jgi:hypothetical protein